MAKTTKKALLLSSLSLLLCFAMLLGTTFAWFTDSVTSSGNKIQAGTLAVKLLMNTGSGYDDISESTDPIFGDANSLAAQNDNADTLWEPGKTQVAYLAIENGGSLDLKYNVSLIVNNVDKDLYEAMEYAIIPDAQYGTVGSWTGGSAVAVGTQPVSDTVALQSGVTHYFALAIHMQEEAGNEYQGGQVEFDIVVNATQLNSEEDSFDETYDENTRLPEVVVDNAADLKAALENANGGVIALAADISGVDANTAISVPAGENVTLDLGGHTLSATADKTGNQELFQVKGTMTVKNGTLEVTAQNNQGWEAMATIFDVTAGGVLNLNGVKATVGGTDMNFIVHLNNWGTATLNVDSCDFTATYVAIRAFNSGYDMNNVTIKNTDFHSGRMFWVHNYTNEGKDDSTLTLDIYNNNNTADHEKPVRFGFDGSVFYDLNGNLIP